MTCLAPRCVSMVCALSRGNPTSLCPQCWKRLVSSPASCAVPRCTNSAFVGGLLCAAYDAYALAFNFGENGHRCGRVGDDSRANQ